MGGHFVTSPREGAAGPEEVARESLRLEEIYGKTEMGTDRILVKSRADRFNAEHGTTLARAYLDLLEQHKRAEKALIVAWLVVDGDEDHAALREALEESGPSHEGSA